MDNAGEKRKDLVMLGEPSKTCTNCLQEMPIKQFSKQKKGTTDGLRYYCKKCCCGIEKERRKKFEKKQKKAINDKSKARIQIDRDSVGNTYMRRLLQARGMGSFANIPDALVELQRERILNMRLARKLKKAANDISKNTY